MRDARAGAPVRREPPRHLGENFVAGGVTERADDALELMDLDQIHGHRAMGGARLDQGVGEHGADQRPRRQPRQRVVVCLMTDRGLAIRDRGAHRIECARESLELGGAGRRHRDRVVAGLQPLDRLGEILDRPGRAAGEQHRQNGSNGEQHRADGEHGVADVVVRAQGARQRALQDQGQGPVRRADRIGPGEELVGFPGDHERRRLGGPIHVDARTMLLRVHRRSQVLISVACHERYVDAQEPRHVRGHAIVQGKPHGGPADPLRREHRRQHHLVGPPVHQAIDLQGLVVPIARDQAPQIGGRCGRQHARARKGVSIGGEHDHQVRIDSHALIFGSGEQRRGVGGRDSLLESIVGGQHLDRGRELRPSELQYLAGGLGRGPQLDPDLSFRFRPCLDCNSDDRGR